MLEKLEKLNVLLSFNSHDDKFYLDNFGKNFLINKSIKNLKEIDLTFFFKNS